MTLWTYSTIDDELKPHPEIIPTRAFTSEKAAKRALLIELRSYGNELDRMVPDSKPDFDKTIEEIDAELEWIRSDNRQDAFYEPLGLSCHIVELQVME